MRMFSWIGKVLSSANGPSTKRHVVAASAGVLCVVTLIIGLACAVWIKRNGDLGSGAVAALTFVGGILAGLAGSAYRKPDGAAVPPAAGGPGLEPGDCVNASSAKTGIVYPQNNAVFGAHPERGRCE